MSLGILTTSGNWMYTCTVMNSTLPMNLLASETGWVRYVTNQDADYFFVYTNALTLEIMTYCEGDCSTVHCMNCVQFTKEILEMDKFYSKL